MKSLRVFDDPALPGDVNMAVDQALLDEAGASPDAVPTLRFYRWSPATLSLGYFQSLDSRHSHVASEILNVVRRTTGGGAIVHDRELTYSLTLPLADRWAAEHRRLYDQIHQAILTFLGAQGVFAKTYQAEAERKESSREQEFLCFLRRSAGDIVLDGFKVGGSAQRRSATALLQHGSILLEKSVYAPELPGIANLSGLDAGDELMATAITESIAKMMGLRPVFLGPYDLFQESILKWRSSRFGNREWTGKR